MEKKGAKNAVPAVEAEETTKHRFSAKSFAAQRQKLGISAAKMGALVGVSAQTIYHWESGKSRPRKPQLAKIASVRELGKKQAKARLERMKA
jgi:DNA-binding transcriptional regulator YiaG